MYLCNRKAVGNGRIWLLFLRGTFVSAKVGYSQSWSEPWSCYITPYLPSKLYFGCNITENDSGFSLSGQKPHKRSPEKGHFQHSLAWHSVLELPARGCDPAEENVKGCALGHQALLPLLCAAGIKGIGSAYKTTLTMKLHSRLM